MLGRPGATLLQVGPATLPLWHLRVQVGAPDAELGPVGPSASRGLSGLGGRGSVGEGSRAREWLPGGARHDPAARSAAPGLGQILPRALRHGLPLVDVERLPQPPLVEALGRQYGVDVDLGDEIEVHG